MSPIFMLVLATVAAVGSGVLSTSAFAFGPPVPQASHSAPEPKVTREAPRKPLARRDHESDYGYTDYGYSESDCDNYSYDCTSDGTYGDDRTGSGCRC
jgi:hypothetical protein